jgi:hypothetical protein
MLSWEERSLVLDKMRKVGLNAYLYAPKEDPLHRQQWKIPYSKTWLDSFSALVKKGRLSGITIVPGIAPGLTYNYLSPLDYALLLKKCRAFVKTGVKTLCLLMDDIPARLPEPCKKNYPSLGAVHGELLTKLSIDLKKTDRVLTLWFCPTIYTDQFMGDDPPVRRYLPDLAFSMPPDTLVFWTGANVISQEISPASIRHVTDIFGDKVCIWDNLYANDYCPHKLFIGPYERRSRDLVKTTSGVLLNPTGLVHIDNFLLELLAGYVQGVKPKKTWETAVSSLPFVKELKIIAPYFNLPNDGIKKALLAPQRRKSVKTALKKLIWEWKSPLQRELYPFLYMLDCDLTLQDKKDAASREALIIKKYSPALAATLCAKN